jgi:hypothetical protein
MKDFEYNWATAEMIIMYLRNSRAQEKRKARKAAEVPGTTQDVPATNTGLTVPSGSTGGGGSLSDDSDSDSDDE